jgi:hypothetical protein
MTDITGLGAISDVANTVISRIWPDKSAAEQQQLAAAVMVVQGQLDINKVEASNPSVFVSGPRPFIMWICGVALGYATILEPLARFAATVFYKYTGPFPVIDTALTLQILFGLLGLGAFRTYEKINGVAAK